MPKKDNFTIIIDTREQLPFLFSGFSCGAKRGALKTGDYSIEGFEEEFTIERKSKSDLYGSFGKGRDRFEREFSRMKDFKYSAMVIEDSFQGLKKAPFKSKIHPNSVIQSILSWSIRYGVFIFTPGNREEAEKLIYDLCEKYLRNKESKGHEGRAAIPL